MIFCLSLVKMCILIPITLQEKDIHYVNLLTDTQGESEINEVT